MPCYMRIEMTVDITAANRDLLLAALKNLGFHATQERFNVGGWVYYENMGRGFDIGINQKTGEIKAQSWTNKSQAELQGIVNEVKREYSKAAVGFAAKKFGWQAFQDKTNINKITVKKIGL
jgi:hypothetical protein